LLHISFSFFIFVFQKVSPESKASFRESLLNTNALFVQVEALSASLQDANVLVQRSTLDLLLGAFPMHCNHLPRSDTVTLVTAAINVVLRRDSSLNRRLYAWLIGTDSNGLPIMMTSHRTPDAESNALTERQNSTASDTDLHYFETHSKSFLIQAVRNSLQEDADGSKDQDTRLALPAVSLRPFKILMILLDKQEIGSAILEDIFLDMLRCMHRECMTKAPNFPKASESRVKSESDYNAAVGEIVKTANLLLGGMEPSFIWQFVGEMLASACQQSVQASQLQKTAVNDVNAVAVNINELCDIVNFLLDKLSMVGFFTTF
jgi:Dopey, N-terminal